MEEGDGDIDVKVQWANTFATDEDETLKPFVVDAETVRLELGGFYALRDDFYIGAEAALVFRGDGILDYTIDGFHDAFDLGNGGRDLRPTDEYEIFVMDETGNRDELDEGLGLADLVLKAHWNVTEGDRLLPAVALQGFLGLPTSTEGFGTDGLDIGVSISFYKNLFDSVFVYGSLGGVILTEPKIEGFEFEKFNLQTSVGGEWAIVDDFSIVVQYMYYSGLLEFPRELNRSRHYVAGGFKWEIVEDVDLGFSVIENLAPFSNSADIVGHLGLGFDL